MMTNNFTLAVNEKDVENLYRQYLTKKFGDIVFTSPFGCDGFGESKKHYVKLLCEFKDDLNLSSKVNQVKVLSQVIYYIKKFEVSGKVLPSVIFVGDRNECFVVHTNDIFGYLGMDLDWSIAPSNAHTNIELVSQMMDDEKIAPHVFSNLEIDQCINKVKDLNDGVKRLIPITPHNVTEVFKHFEDKVVGKHSLNTNQMANLFVQLLINPDQNYLHPVARRKTVVTKAFGEINLKSREVFSSFFSHFSREYTPKQREHLTAVVDRLIQDVTRRKQGEFFTPTIWVDKAHEYIASIYGDDWKEKYVVWDPAWGTGNLTRDYKFKELYASTLVYADIETANQMGYNPEAVKFQSDFLNDGYDFIPAGLKSAIESKKEILIFFNPPYATSNNMGTEEGDHKAGVSDTEIGEEMKNNKWGAASRNIYAQFLYRICKLKEINPNIKIALFCKPNYMTASDYKTFRKNFLSYFGYSKGFLFQASHFADVSSQWGISFSIFDNLPNNVKNNFEHDLLDQDENFKIYNLGKKILYNLDNGVEGSEWVRETNKGKENIDTIQLKSALKPGFSNTNRITENAITYLLAKSNNVLSNANNVAFLSSSTSNRGGMSVDNDNFIKACALFCARKSIKGNWINDKDEYLSPDVKNVFFIPFSNDSIVYSMFNNSSEQSSLRNVEYKNQFWNVKNQFFWMSKDEMTNLANQGNYLELYNDVRTDSDRYAYKLLFGEERIYDQLSDEAKDVLDTAINLVRLSFGMRRNFADDSNHLNSWDAGYAQLKLLWKEYFPDQFKEFRDKYKLLEDKLRPMVYELGFLKK